MNTPPSLESTLKFLSKQGSFSNDLVFRETSGLPLLLGLDLSVMIAFCTPTKNLRDGTMTHGSGILVPYAGNPCLTC